MKKRYTIGEICSLYNIGPDSMRYYEKMGLISPARDNSGYRIYTADDAWRLNVIKDLRRLDFSVSDIRDYLDSRSLKSTEQFIQRELELVRGELQSLLEIESNLKRRLAAIKVAEEAGSCDSIEIIHIGERRLVFTDEDICSDSEIDMALGKLQSMGHEKIFLLGNRDMGAVFDYDAWLSNSHRVYTSVFFLVGPNDPSDGILPGGLYAVSCYRGESANVFPLMERMLRYISENGYCANGKPIELYRVDIHDTQLESEFLTEVRIPVKKL